MFWAILFLGMIILTVLGAVYLVRRIARFGFVKKAAGDSAKKARLIAAALMLGTGLILAALMGIWNTMVVFIFLLVFWLVCDFAALVVRKITGRESRRYYAGAAAILAALVYFSAGWYFAHHVYETHYDIAAEDDLGVEGLRIVAFSDSHLGTTFHYEKFNEYIDRMNAAQPDIVVIMGDFVDDNSPKEDMEKCCAALGRLNTRYGVYYAFGNHDKGYSPAGRGYDDAELVENLEKNGVHVLTDDIVPIAGNICLLGRLDNLYDRQSMMELSARYTEDNFVIVLDHEPNDYANEAAYNADLVISGHTHGGQFFPVNRAGEWMKMNDRTYGYEKRGGTQFLVSSGIADWEIQFKTGCISEYLVIDVK